MIFPPIDKHSYILQFHSVSFTEISLYTWVVFLSRRKAALKQAFYLKSTYSHGKSTIFCDLFQGYDKFGVPLQAGDRNKNKM